MAAAVGCFSFMLSSGPVVRNPQGAAGAEGQPEGRPEGEGAASNGETGQRLCLVSAQTDKCIRNV